MAEPPSTRTAVTQERCAHVESPFYHGTKIAFQAAR